MQLDTRLRFETFIVGSANRLAVAASRAVAEAPGDVYNPLFIYSGSGLGKTHLMTAIGNLVVQRHPKLEVALVSLDDLIGQIHAAVASGDVEGVKQRYLRVGLLLIDDVQFLTGHRETQTELLRVLTALQAAGGQIVMSSDRPPAEIADVDERLLTRMAGGLIADIGSPDYETRSAILRSKCEQRGVSFRPGVVEGLARLEFTNVRELQGALNRLIAVQTLGGQPLGPSDVLTVLGELAESSSRTRPRRSSGEFQSLVSEVASALARQVDEWRTRLAEAIAYWKAEGYRTGPLDSALQEDAPSRPLDQILRGFEQSVAKIRSMERAARELDPTLAANEVFRDPERAAEAEALIQRARRAAAPPPAPSASFTRQTFAMGTTNQLAVRAADAVIAEPGQRYNPLFLHGPSGVGKTHLLNAIGNQLLHAAQNAHVATTAIACLPAHTFVDELIGALQDGTVDRWRLRYRQVVALLLDDVQILAGKERTQEELFHVFNVLHAEGKQLVFASDRAPRELPGLEERLRSRFEGGLVAEMSLPDRSLRELLYARFLGDLGARPDAALLSFLAEQPVRSAREILGTVNRLVSAAEVADTPLTVSFARAELSHVSSAPIVAGIASEPQAAGVAFFLDREKLVWDWEDLTARLIEDVR